MSKVHQKILLLKHKKGSPINLRYTRPRTEPRSENNKIYCHPSPFLKYESCTFRTLFPLSSSPLPPALPSSSLPSLIVHTSLTSRSPHSLLRFSFFSLRFRFASADSLSSCQPIMAGCLCTGSGTACGCGCCGGGGINIGNGA